MSKKAKQQYLSTHIIEQGLDPGKFVSFLQAQRPQGRLFWLGDDIDNWSLDSLQEVVGQYKKKHIVNYEDNFDAYEEESQKANKEIERYRERTSSYHKSSANPKLTKLLDRAKEEKNSLTVQIIEAEIKSMDWNQTSFFQPTCRRTQTKSLRIQVILNHKSPHTVDKGFFSKKYVAFKVMTNPFEFEVDRRFSDFFWLRNILQRDYPGLYVNFFDTDSTNR